MSINVDHIRHESATKAKGATNKIKRFAGKLRERVGKVVSIDEDWIFKSKDWPYLWRK